MEKEPFNVVPVRRGLQYRRRKEVSMKGQNTEQTKNILQQQTIINVVSINPKQPQPERSRDCLRRAALPDDWYMEAETRQARETLSQNEPAPRTRTTQEPPGYEDGRR